MPRALLAHVVSRFAPRQWENVATECLHYLLARPAAEDALRQLVAPTGLDLPAGLSWSTQATAAGDQGIPDLVGNDDQGRHVLVVESKFWAGLTGNQPTAYLARQRQQFSADGLNHLLLFLAPERRLDLLAAELAERTGATVTTRSGGLLRLEAGADALAVASWGALLNLLQSSLAADQEALADLVQLRGLCDRADSEALLPVEPEEVGSDRGRRVWEYMDLVDRVTDRLVAAKVVDVKGLRATGAKGWYGRYLRSTSGSILRLSVSTWQWGWKYPTPWWIRIWTAESDVEHALRPLVGHEVAYMYRTDEGRLYLGLPAPLLRDEDATVARLADAVRAVCMALPVTSDDANLDAVEAAAGAGDVPEN